MTKTNVQSTPSNSQHHDTPNNKTHVIKFRVTAEEKASLELTCKLLNLSLSTFIRRAIHLTAFRLHAEKVLGELYGNAQAYRLSRKGSCIVQP
ncbi:MAG: hypothetical protein KHZ84_10920 [Faecalibacterium prausnitzii]|nr:hypothetical protein [Faecalibacterium prausnitzii]